MGHFLEARVVKPSIKSKVVLREVTSINVRSICDLGIKEEQRNYVVQNAIAIAEACFSDTAWFRAVYADETPVGLAVVECQLPEQRYLLWRFMIDARYQGMGLGRKAMVLLIDHIRKIPDAKEFLTSVVPGEHCPQVFYEKLGFELTGEWDDGEAVMRLTF